MSNSTSALRTGGCQCGAIRYRIDGPVFDAQICHCRMCQKAFGSYFAPLGGVRVEHITWSRGRPSLFRSSTAAVRGFCSACGTPLTFQYDSEPHEVSIALGTLDDPADVPPLHQYGMESRMPWFAGLALLPSETTEGSTPDDLMKSIHGRQHPDHESPQGS